MARDSLPVWMNNPSAGAGATREALTIESIVGVDLSIRHNN
jgi:hypothetical protein